MNRTQEREAWTALIEGRKPKQNKYGAKKTGGYDSRYESEIAGNLKLLEKSGVIQNLREQVPVVLVEGRGKIKPIKYVADFVFEENGKTRYLDAKGYKKNPVYLIKRKLAMLLHGIHIEEI